MIDVDEALDKFYQYYKGRGGATINYDEAYKIAIKIAKQEQLLGNHLLGICNQYGVGIKQNIPEAIRLFMLNVNKNNCTSMVQLGLLYKNSKLYENDYNYEKAADMFTRAANLGNVDSMRYLGNMYSRASGEDQIPIDLEKAAYYYKLAADHGDKIAAEKYGNMLVNGNGVPKNTDEALRYYNMANSSENVKTKIEMLNHKGSEDELTQKVNEKYASSNPLKRLGKNADEINWEWGKVFYFE